MGFRHKKSYSNKITRKIRPKSKSTKPRKYRVYSKKYKLQKGGEYKQYIVTFAMIIHGCLISTELNTNYNIELYNATGNNIDVCEKTIGEFNNEHINLQKHFRKNMPTTVGKDYFDKIPYDKFIGSKLNDRYTGVWLISVHDNNNNLVFPSYDSLDIKYNLFNLNLLNRLLYVFNTDEWFSTKIKFTENHNRPSQNIHQHNEMKDSFLKEHKSPPEKNNEGYRDFAGWNVSVNDVENPTHIDKIRLTYFLDRLKYIFGDNVKFRAYDYTCTIPCNYTDDIKINVPLKNHGGKNQNKKKKKNKTILSR